MPSFTQLFTLSLLAAVGLAVPSSSGIHRRCLGATVESNNTISVNGNDIVYTITSCLAPSLSRRDDPPPPTNVCGDLCTTSCNDAAGNLPPISQDCQTIVDSIQIFQSVQGDIFNVTSNHMETLTFNTCSFFFENFSGSTLSSCFSSLSTDGSAAGAACFPPVQPFFSRGLCTAADGSWAIGSSHS